MQDRIKQAVDKLEKQELSSFITNDLYPLAKDSVVVLKSTLYDFADNLAHFWFIKGLREQDKDIGLDEEQKNA